MIPSRPSHAPLPTGSPAAQQALPFALVGATTQHPGMPAYPACNARLPQLVPVYPQPSVGAGTSGLPGPAIGSAAALPAGAGPPPVLRTRSQQRAWLQQQGLLPIDPGQAFAPASRPAPPSVPNPVCGIFWDYENAPLPAASDAASAAARTLSELCRPFGSTLESRVYHDSAKSHSISGPHRTVLSQVCAPCIPTDASTYYLARRPTALGQPHPTLARSICTSARCPTKPRLASPESK